jgi:hypothetical protein
VARELLMDVFDSKAWFDLRGRECAVTPTLEK